MSEKKRSEGADANNEWKREEKGNDADGRELPKSRCARHHLILDFAVVFLWLEKSVKGQQKGPLRRDNKGCPSDSSGSTRLLTSEGI